MSTLIRKVHQAQGHPTNDMSNTHNAQENVKPLKTAWEYYNEATEIIDRERERDWLEQMDTILIFAGLFAAFLSAFLLELLSRLEQDPTDAIQDILIYQTHMMRNASLGPYVPSAFAPPGYIVAVNALFYASLSLMLLAAFIAMLIKNWVREFDRGLRGMSIAEQRAKTREFRHQGLVRWKLSEMVAFLPILIQMSLLLFSIGLALFLFHIDTLSSAIAVVVLGIGVIFYGITTTISAVVTSSPFRSPLSRGLGVVYQRLHAAICPRIDYFFSNRMDVTPVSIHASLKRRFRLFLLKGRPYPEGRFVEPFGDDIADSININVSRKALEWLYGNVPTSRHSEQLHWAAWTAAASPAFRAPPFLPIPPWVTTQFQYAPSFLEGYPLSTCFAFAAVFSQTYLPDRSLAQAILHRLNPAATPWHELVSSMIKCRFEPEALNGLIDLIRKRNLTEKEIIWMLETLHRYCNHLGWLGQVREKGVLIDICRESLRSLIVDVENLATPEGGMLADSAIMLAADALLPLPPLRDRRWKTLLLERDEQPWTLRGLRSTLLITEVIESAHSSQCDQVLLQQFFFLVFLYLGRRRSWILATTCLNLLTRDYWIDLWTPCLAAFARTMTEAEVILGVRLWMTRDRDRLSLIQDYNFQYTPKIEKDYLKDLFTTYDTVLADTDELDAGLLVALLSNGTPRYSYNNCWLTKNPLKHSRWHLAALTIVGEPVPDTLIPEVWDDHRTLNLIASRQLQYIHSRSSRSSLSQQLRLVASFLQSQEFAIALLSLKLYIDIMNPNPRSGDLNNPVPVQSPPHHLPNSVRVVFNSTLPHQRLLESWVVMQTLMGQWSSIPADWQRTFAIAFWTCSHRPCPRLSYEPPDNVPEMVLMKIITWNFVEAMQKEPKFTECDGLHWFVTLWTLWRANEHEGETENPGEKNRECEPLGIDISGSLVLDALCKLLGATPDVSVIPLLLRIRDFIKEVDGGSTGTLANAALARLEGLCTLKYARFSCKLSIN